MNVRSLSAAVALACVTALPAAHATNGYMSHAYSPTAKGLAGAGEAALPQDSMSLVGNPAGLTRVGQRADVGLAWFSPQREYSGVTPNLETGAFAPIGGGIDGRGTVDSENNHFFIPNFGYTHPIDNVSAAGIAVFGNGGLDTDYRSKDTLFGLGTYGGNNPDFNPPALPGLPPDYPFLQRLGGGDAGVHLEQLGISLGYARDLADNFSLGASFLIAYQTFKAKGLGAFQSFTKTFAESALAGMPVSPGNLTDRGDDSSWGYGFQIGALWDINPQFTLGISYRTKMWMDEFDKYSDLFADGGDFDIPPVGSIGLAYKPNDQLTLAFDIQQIWYGDVDAVSNKNNLADRCNLQQNPMGIDTSYCLGGKNGAGFGWDDMTVFKFGVQYQFNDQWTGRAGFSYADQLIDGREVAFNALAPAVIQQHWTLGATWRLRQDYELDFWGAYMPEESVKGPGEFTGFQAPEIKMSQYELGVNFRWLFN
jgi:long-chain fatty acid transport protein